MFEKARAKPRNMLSVLVVAAMVLSAVPLATAGGPEGGSAPRAITDDANDLIIPEGELYELSGCHTYKKSVQINGVLNVKPYDGGDETTGMLWLKAPNITIGPNGGIFAQGRGYGGGGGGLNYYSQAAGGYGGTGGKGGNGGNAQSYYMAGGGGGGSNGGRGGSGYSASNGEDGTELKGGNGASASYSGGSGGAGFGSGGGGGGAYYGGGAGGGGGGTGGKDSSWYNGGDGGGPYGGKGPNGVSWTTPGANEYGRNGGYRENKTNGDSSTDLSVWRGSGGSGGATVDYYYGGGGGGGGAGGGAVTLLADQDLKVSGQVWSSGGSGGQGGGNLYGSGARGGGGAGGGLALSGQKVIIAGVVDAMGRDGTSASATNGGTIKILYGEVLQKIGTVQGGREYSNGRPKMKGLDSPLANAQVVRKPLFKWNEASDPEKDPITYELELATTTAFNPVSRRQAGIDGTSWSFLVPLSGTMYWRVRAADQCGPGGWSEVRKFIVDDKAPVSRIDFLPEYSTSQEFLVSWTGTDNEGGSGIANYTIKVSDNGEMDYTWLEGTQATSAMFTGKEGHSYQFYSQATDFADNRESPAPDAKVITTVDSVPPTCSISAMPAYQSKPAFMVSWSGRDVTSGIAEYSVFVSIDGADFVPWVENTTEVTMQYVGAEGRKYTFFVLARDVAGNIQDVPGPEKHITTRVDGTAPVTAFMPSPPGYGEGPTYIRLNSVIYLNGTDNAAGVNRTVYQIDKRNQQEYTKGFRETQGGSHNMTFWSIDEAGNEEAHRVIWFWVDGESPVTSLAFIGPNWFVAGKVYISPRTMLTFDAADKGSGVNRTIYNIDGAGYEVYTEPFKLPKSGLHSMKFRSVDNLGQEDTEKNASIIMDIWTPTSVALVDSKISGQDIVVELRGTDLESGLAGVYYRVVKKGELGMNFVNGTLVTIPALPDHSRDGTYLLEYYAVDNVGNTEQTRKMELVIDTVGNLTVSAKGGTTVSEQVYHVTGTTEPGSTLTVNGLRVLVKPDGSFDYELELKEGLNKILIISIDPAGNPEMVTRTVTYSRSQPIGILIPIIAVVVIVAVVGAAAYAMMRRRTRPAASPPPQMVTAPPPAPPAPPSVPPPVPPAR